MNPGFSAEKALEKLKEGNRLYVLSGSYRGDVSADMRLDTAEHGQSPYAVVVACSDSRVIPEAIFSAGIGELFVIRVAGNVISQNQLGSVEYAAEHLGCRLVLILGHTCCGAVAAALEAPQTGHVASITEEIRRAVGGETDPTRASVKNVENSVKKVRSELKGIDGLVTVGGIYDIKTGAVEFLEAPDKLQD